jgi:myo-inositol-1(or 4)-monophosphatase
MKIFISYADASRESVLKVAALCEQAGHKPWVAFLHLDWPGEFTPEIFKHIDDAEGFILFLTPDSMSATYQRQEWMYARKKKPTAVLYLGEWIEGYDRLFACAAEQHHQVAEEDRVARVLKNWSPPHLDRLRFMQALAIEAGMQLMQQHGIRFLQGRPTARDDRKNPAFNIDESVQAFIVSRIRSSPIYGGEEILAEEAGMRTVRSTQGLVWTVDALDGTLNFVSGDDRFCCGIGILQDGEPILGVIFSPSRMELYSGCKNQGAERRMIHEGGVEELVAQKGLDELAAAHVVTHINSEENLIDLCFQDDFPKRLHRSARRVWMWGCGLLSLIAVARGSHHLFVQRHTYPWDVVPGLAILRAAGGVDSIWPSNDPKAWILPGPESPQGLIAASNERLMASFFREFC